MEDQEKHTTSIPPGMAAAATYFFPFIGGLVMLALEKEDRFVRFNAAQSVLFWVLAIPIAVLSCIPIIGIIGDLLSIVFVVAWIFLIYQAWTHREFEIPYLGEIARKQVFKDEDEPVVAEKPAPKPESAPEPEAPAEDGVNEEPEV
jgi:uncharacterized membrane protein